MKNIATHTDHELSLLISAGNEDAFRALFEKYRNKIFSIAWKFTETEETAEDLTQEVFIKLWLNKEKLSNVENLNAYINTVVRNHIFNYLRKIAAEQKFLQKLAVKKIEKSKTDVDTVCYKELQELIHEAVNQLPPQQKRVYNFSREEGLKHEEIAERMGISRSTVKGHIVEALNYIRKYLAANGEVVAVLLFFFL